MVPGWGGGALDQKQTVAGAWGSNVCNVGTGVRLAVAPRHLHRRRRRVRTSSFLLRVLVPSHTCTCAPHDTHTPHDPCTSASRVVVRSRQRTRAALIDAVVTAMARTGTLAWTPSGTHRKDGLSTVLGGQKRFHFPAHRSIRVHVAPWYG